MDAPGDPEGPRAPGGDQEGHSGRRLGGLGVVSISTIELTCFVSEAIERAWGLTLGFGLAKPSGGSRSGTSVGAVSTFFPLALLLSTVFMSAF